jgi:hypothetical protein
MNRFFATPRGPSVEGMCMTTTPSTAVHVKPRIWPRSVLDFCIVMFLIAPILIFVLFVVPSLIAFLLTGSLEITLLIFLLIYVAYLCFTVWSITLDAEGIRFHRLIGRPKFLPWSSVLEIEVAPRWEMICCGQLWPRFPPLEMTASLATTHHYRISWRSGYCYYPPVDPAAFESVVRTLWVRHANELAE